MAQGTVNTPPLGFSCTCGTIQGALDPVAKRSGTHLMCHCSDCRAAQLYLDQPDPGQDGVDLFQMAPDTITFRSGTDHLAAFRLGPKGPLRWYAACCNAAMFNTLASPKLSFSTLHVARLTTPNAIGPVTARSFVPRPGQPPKHQGTKVMIWRLVARMGAARLSGRWRKTPFFDPSTGKPIAAPVMVTKEDRAKLYPDQRNTKG